MSCLNSYEMEGNEPPKDVSNSHSSEERQTEDGNHSPGGTSSGWTAFEGTSVGDVREPSKRDCDRGVVEKMSEERLLTPKEKQSNDKTDLFICSETVPSIIPSVVGQTEDEDDNHSDIMRKEVSEKGDNDEDYTSDEDSPLNMSMHNSQSVEDTSILSTENVNRVPCKRKKPMKYHRKLKKRRLKSGNKDGNGDNFQASNSLDKDGEQKLRIISKPVKIPFRFSPKKSCSGSRFKRRLMENKRKTKKLRLKRRKVELEIDSDSDDESGFGVDDELEKMLENNATKNNLTAINVKSILHHVITNEHVLAMVRNTMLDEEKKEQSGNNQSGGEGDGVKESQEAHFEPKMTRSKLKEVVQQVGTAPYVWPLSPVKGKKVVPQFAELHFPEDSEDDEDYQPDPNEKEESDHESCVSSQVSDFGSPLPSTPLSRHSFLDNKEESPSKEENKSENQTTDAEKTSTPTHPHLKVKAAPMQPPSSRQQSEKINDDKFMMMLDEMDKELDSMNQNTLGMDIIAKRTRSKLTIENTLNEIEASFIAPDSTADMYDSDCDDEEWKDWLNDLFKDKKDNELNDTFDDEQNDPDFNFMADEEEVIDTEETRTDRAVRVSKKELNVLLDELLESYGEETGWNETFEVPKVEYHAPKTLAAMLSQMRTNKPANNQSTPAIPKIPVKIIPIVIPDERLQLQQQMQQHVQLLCQMNLLGRNDTKYNMEASQAKMFLNELAMLGGITPQDGSSDVDTSKQPMPSDSAFIACNLGGALEIVNSWSDEKSESATPSKEKGSEKQEDAKGSTEKNYNSKAVPNDAKIILMSSIVFMYPELLPHCGLKYQTSNKPTFLDSENHLIVLGLQQFGKFEKKLRLIQKHMVPDKTVKQIQARIKNFSARKKGQNIIKNFRKHKVIPPSLNPCEPVLPGQEIAPIFQFQNRLPDWMKNLKTTSLMKLERGLEKEREMEERTKRAVFASLDECTDHKKKKQLPKTSIPISRGMQLGMTLPGTVQGAGSTLPVAIVQTVNGQHIIQLLPNKVLCNPGVLPTFINMPPHQVSSSGVSLANINVGATQAVTSTQNTQTKTGGSVISVPTSNTSTKINNVMKQSINQDLIANPIQISNKNAVSGTTNQQGNSQNTALTPSASQCITMSTPSATTTVSSAYIINLQQAQSSEGIAVNSFKTSQTLSNVSGGTGVPQPTIIMIPPITQAQAKFLVQQDNVVLVQDNRNTLNSNGNQTDTSGGSLPNMEGNQKMVSNSFQKALVPSKSQIIQLSPGKHGPVIQFGGRKSLTKDSKKEAEVVGKSIMPSCLSKGGADGISALRGFQIHHVTHDSTTVSDQPQANQEDKSEKKTVEKSGENEANSPLTITDTVEESEALSIQIMNDGKSSPSVQTSPTAEPHTTKHSEIPDAKDSQFDTKDSPCTAGTSDSNITEASPACLPMEPVIQSNENSQRQPQTDLDISKDSGMPIEDDSVCHYNEDDDSDDVEVDVITADDEDMKGIQEQEENEKKTYEAGEDRQMEDDIDDFELDVVSVSDSKSSAIDVKDLATEEITKSPTKSQDPVDIEDCQDNNPDEGNPMEPVSDAMSEKQVKASRKVAAKRLKSRLRKEMESTVVLLDPDIVENDPKKTERDDVFARAYLNRVKDTFKNQPYKYLEFLKVLADFQSDELHISQFYDRIKNVLVGQDELIEDFTAFLDPEQAVKCGVLMSHLEFSKARLFLREVEVHFQKQSGHFQKILKAIVIWGETEDRTYQQLKDLLLPLLKGQPHLEQELSGLFPDDKPAENLMPDFEMAEWCENKEFDGYEEIELPDSDEEKHMKGKISTGKLDIVDPWRRLNAELQYGTKRCRCSCHDRSLDSRVQKKTRHCAYCTAKVSRAELTGSFRGIASVKGRTSRSTRRKVSKAQKGSREFTNMEANENEEDQDDGNPYSAAVSNLSEMCNNLADYLNENVCEEIEEVEEEPGDVETEEEDIEEMEIDDEEADDEVRKLIGNGLVTEDDPELITGADTASSNSPDAEVSSQESKGSSESDESNFASPLSKSPLSHSTSLVEYNDKDRSATNSPIRYSCEDSKTEDTITRILSTPEGSERKDFEHICANSDNVDNSHSKTLPILSNERVEKLPTDDHTSIGSSISKDNERENSHPDIRSHSASDTHALSSGETEALSDSSGNAFDSSVISSNQDNTSIVRCTDSDIEEIKEPSPSLEKDVNQIESIGEPFKGQLIEKQDEQKCDENVKICKIQESIVQTESKDSSNKCLEDLKNVSTSDERIVETRETRETAGLKSKMSADNIRQTSDGNVIVSWTRDDDRLLLQTCQKMDNDRSAFKLVSQELGNKSISEVEDRFNTLMALFTKRPKSDGEESGDRSDSEHSSTSDVDE